MIGNDKWLFTSLAKIYPFQIWLLESYVVLTNGDLREAGVNGATPPSDATHSFPALKMLYKVFDAESAAS